MTSIPVWQPPHAGKVWFVTRYEDVVAGFLDHDALSSTIFESSHSAVFGPSLTAMDGDEHSQKRAIIAPEFVGRKLEAFLPVIEDNVRRLIVGFTEKAARELVEGFIDRRETDLVDTFSTRLPVNVIVDMLALPQSDHDRFHYWYPTFLAGLSPDPVLRKKGIEANTEFHDYLEPFVQERLRNPGEDLISRLCEAEVDGEKLTVHDIKSFVSLLLTAGGETTDRAIANLWWLLLNHPEQFEAVRQDHSLIDQAFTETMRCEAPVGGEVRLVMQRLGDAGRDRPRRERREPLHPRRQPRRACLRRPGDVRHLPRRPLHRFRGSASHIGFGLGKHFCVGYQLARGDRRSHQARRNPVTAGTRAGIEQDHDGVLVETEQWYYLANKRALASLGIDLPREVYLANMANGVSAWERARACGIAESEVRSARERRNEYYQEYLATEDIEIEGVLETLAELAGTYRMAVVTTAKPPDFALIHENRSILDHMEFCLTRGDYERAKPHPEPPGRTRALRASAAETVVVDRREG